MPLYTNLLSYFPSAHLFSLFFCIFRVSVYILELPASLLSLPRCFFSLHIDVYGRLESASSFNTFTHRQIYWKGNISLYCFISEKLWLGMVGQFMLLIIRYTKTSFLLMHVHFNKKHREGYNQNICDYRQILPKTNRKKVFDCIKECATYLFTVPFIFLCSWLTYSEDKPEKPSKIISKWCCIICGFCGNLWAQFMVQYPISLTAILLL